MQYKTVYFTCPSIQCLYYNICTMYTLWNMSSIYRHCSRAVVIGSDVSFSAGRITTFGSYLSYMRTLRYTEHTHSRLSVSGYLVIAYYYYTWILDSHNRIIGPETSCMSLRFVLYLYTYYIFPISTRVYQISTLFTI